MAKMKNVRNLKLLESSLAPIVSLVANLFMVYVVYMVTRIVFLVENYRLFSEHLVHGHLPEMFWAGIKFDSSAIAYTNALYIVMMLFPLFLKETLTYHKVCKYVFVAINALALIVNLADSVYFPYTKQRTTTSVFKEFSNEDNLGGIFLNEAVGHWYLILVAAFLIYCLWKLYLMPNPEAKRLDTLKERIKYTIIMVAALLAAIPWTVGACRGGLGTDRPITISNANEFVDHPVECALVLNTPFSLIRTIGKSVFTVPPYFTQEQLDKVFKPIHQPVKRDSVMKKNVVILIVESFGREYIGAFNKELEGGKYKGFTPNMDSIIAQSLVFRHSFCNGRKSIDAMPSILCGIPMFVEPFILTPASMNDYTGMGNIFNRKGYETAFFHGAERGSMGFLAFSKKIGYKNYYGWEDYAADKRFGGDKDYDGHWGIWDEPFMQYSCAKMSEMRQPFMTTIFTVSSHHPFRIPDKYKNRFRGGKLPIHKCIQYTDMAIGKFFAKARTQSWFKNTLFVVFSDHTNMSCHPEYKSDIGLFSSPVIFYDPSGDIQPGVSNAIAQQIDLLPTLLGMLGYDQPYLSFGCDLMATPTEKTYAVNYLNGIYQYVKYGHVLQFDGEKTKAVYSLEDRTMKRNLIGKVPRQKQMENELKAIIQQYMYRMTNNKLKP